MLQRIRDVVQGWIATIIFALLIIPFAFWGINYYFDQGGDATAARVNDGQISLRDYQRALQTIRQRWQSLAGDPPDAGQDGLIREQALNGLIERELLRQAANAWGARIGDEQVRAAIREVAAFQGANGFDETMYQSALSAAGLSPAGFEAQVREDMKAEQLQSAVADSTFVTDGEIDRLLQIRNQLRDFRYAVISADEAKETAQATPEEVEAYYREHAGEFTEPAKVRVAYLDLSLDRIALDVTAADEDLRGWYADNLANFSVQEQRSLRQILVTVPEGAGEDQVAAASKKADELREQVAAGAAMDQVATGQAENKEAPIEFTEFGFLSQGVLEPEVESVVFALNVGETSSPVRSKFGFHILEVTEVRAGSTPPFEEVRAQVDSEYRQAQAEKQFYELADQLANLVFEHPDSLQEASEALALPVRESEFFSREAPGQGIFANPKLIDAAFSEEVLENGHNSESIELEPGHLVVLRVLEHVPQRQTPLDQVSERIVTRLRFDKGQQLTAERGRAAIAELRHGADMAAVGERYGLAWEQAGGVRRDAANINRAIVRAAFRAGNPAPGKTVFDGISLGTGDFAVVAVTGVTAPDPGSFSDDERAAARKELREQLALRAWAQFLADLKSAAEIQIYRENLQ
jgi:peptidyl-prolyl cis-trans isomerase D